MTYDPAVHHRRSMRLKGYDYARSGAYFVTLCVEGRQCLFGAVVDDRMELNALGEVVASEWARTASVRPDVELDEFAIMPNHMHGIIVLTNETLDLGRAGRATHRVAPTDTRPPGPAPGSIGAILAQFKSLTAKGVNRFRGTPGAPVWQRNDYEHVIRDEDELERAREYIINNPRRWALDQENPATTSRVGTRR